MLTFVTPERSSAVAWTAPRWLACSASSRFAGKAKSFLTQANTPLPERLQCYSFLKQNPATNVFTAEFLNHVNTHRPAELLRSVYNTPADASALNRMLFMDWQITLADNDIRKVGKSTESLSFYNEVEKLASNAPNLLYNMGFVYFAQQHNTAQAYAKRAYISGITLPGLQRKLQQAGHWN